MVSRLTNARRVSSATFDIRHSSSKSSDLEDVTTLPCNVGMPSREAHVQDDSNIPSSGLGLVSHHGGQDYALGNIGASENTIYHIQDHIKVGVTYHLLRRID